MDENTKRREEKTKRRALTKALVKQTQKEISAYREKRDAVLSQQIEAEAPEFPMERVGNNIFLTPPYDPHELYAWAIRCDIVKACTDAMVQNVDGFGYKLVYLGDDTTVDEDDPEKERIKNILDQANEYQSFTTIRKRLRTDLEVIGYGGIEVVRYTGGEIFLYPIKAVNLRMTQKLAPEIPVKINIKRDGKIVTLTVNRKFRKFAQVRSDGKIRYFKEFGDPRYLNKTTGEYFDTPIAPEQNSTEIWFFRHDFGVSAYGCPPWVAAILDVMGRYKSKYINMDLMDSQGIPPMLITVSNGSLTDESYEELQIILDAFRGYQNFNRIACLESEFADTSIDGTSGSGNAKIELKNMVAFRQSDLMFKGYLKQTGEDIRHTRRIPDLYLGISESYTHATSKAAQAVAEEQVFIPERKEFDERFHLEFTIPELNVRNWKMVSKGPQIVGASQITQGVNAFKDALTVNSAIDLANTAFGTEMSHFREEWAKYPISLVMEWIKLGKIDMHSKVDQSITDTIPDNTEPPPDMPEDLPDNQQELLKALYNIRCRMDDIFKNDGENYAAEEMLPDIIKNAMRFMADVGEELASYDSTDI